MQPSVRRKYSWLCARRTTSTSTICHLREHRYRYYPMTGLMGNFDENADLRMLSRQGQRAKQLSVFQADMNERAVRAAVLEVESAPRLEERQFCLQLPGRK